MASTRLTQTQKKEILEKVIQHRFTKYVEELREEYANFADKVYNEVHKKQMAAMYALPEGWLQTTTRIVGQFNNNHDNLAFNGRYTLGYSFHSLFNFPDSVQRRVLDKTNNTHVFDTHHPLTVEHSKLNDKRKDLIEEISQATAQVKAILNAVTTRNKLLASWPEVEPFLPPVPEKTQLPAIPRKQINQLLNLPKEDAA